MQMISFVASAVDTANGRRYRLSGRFKDDCVSRYTVESKIRTHLKAQDYKDIRIVGWGLDQY